YCLISGKRAAFALGMGGIVAATSVCFNPLSTNLNHIYKSELAEQITAINKKATGRPLWLCYGGVMPGMLVTALGRRSLSGVHWPPQLELWRALVPKSIGYEEIYNRYAEVTLEYRENPVFTSFSPFSEGAFFVKISPHNKVIREMGARYVLAIGEAQE